MPKKYIKMKIDEISAVDNPANDKQFLIMKNYEENDEELNEGGELNMEELNLEKALEMIENEDAKELIKNAISKTENTQKDENNEPKDNDVNKGSDEEVEDIDKNELPEAIQKKLDDMQSELSATKKLAKQEREKRLDIEFKKKAEGFTQVAEIDKISSVLRKAHDAEFGDELEEILKSANERIENGDFTKEVGDEGDDITDPHNELEKRADKIQEDNSDLTREQAFAKALDDDPSLYTDYLNS